MNTMPGPYDTAAINPCAYLLTWSWRLIVTRRSHCPLLGTLLDDACGNDAGKVFRALCSFLCTLAQARRRRLEVHPPGYPELTHDEKCLLAMIAAAQDDRPALLDAHLCWIAHGDQQENLARSVRTLASALDAAGLWLPTPDDHASTMPGWHHALTTQVAGMLETPPCDAGSAISMPHA